LPAALGLAAMVLAGHHGRSIAGAGVLAGLALLCKQSALWAPAALLAWLLVERRRQTVPFAASFAGTVIVGGVAAQHFSGGRFVDQVGSLTFAGLGVISLPQAALRTLGTALESLPGLWVLFPFALLAVLLTALERRLDRYHLALVAALGISVLTLQDFGVGDNQLVDFAALSAVVTGRLWIRGADGGQVLMRAALAAAVVWAGATAFVLDVRPLVRDSLAIALGRTAYPSFTATLAALPKGPLLSEHPAVPLARGDLPVIVDAWVIARLADREPQTLRPLLDRIGRQDFAAVLLLHRLEPAETDVPYWYQYQHFGKAVVHELRLGYRYQETTDDGLHIYVPKTP
jgi:hypothetical protein